MSFFLPRLRRITTAVAAERPLFYFFERASRSYKLISNHEVVSKIQVRSGDLMLSGARRPTIKAPAYNSLLSNRFLPPANSSCSWATPSVPPTSRTASSRRPWARFPCPDGHDTNHAVPSAFDEQRPMKLAHLEAKFFKYVAAVMHSAGYSRE